MSRPTQSDDIVSTDAVRAPEAMQRSDALTFR
jgi:hypothetical protein